MLTSLRKFVALSVLMTALALGGCFFNPMIPEVQIADEAGNLVQNPSADQGEEYWQKATADAFVQGDSGNPAFTSRNGAHMWQTIDITSVHGNYVVLVGISATQTIQVNGMGNISCHFNDREDASHQFGKLDSPPLTSTSNTPNEWVVLADYALIPRDTGSVTVFLSVTNIPGESHDGTLTWFDDIGLYIVDTLQEAIDLVDDYTADHTW